MTDAERDAERERQEADRRTMQEIRDRDADLPLRVFVLAERLPVSEVTASGRLWPVRPTPRSVPHFPRAARASRTRASVA